VVVVPIYSGSLSHLKTLACSSLVLVGRLNKLFSNGENSTTKSIYTKVLCKPLYVTNFAIDIAFDCIRNAVTVHAHDKSSWTYICRVPRERHIFRIAILWLQFPCMPHVVQTIGLYVYLKNTCPVVLPILSIWPLRLKHSTFHARFSFR